MVSGNGGKIGGVRGNRHRLLGPRIIPAQAHAVSAGMGAGNNTGINGASTGSISGGVPGGIPGGSFARPLVPGLVPNDSRDTRDGSSQTAPLNVLFVCIGNSCRSQMAEGFAKTYGSDVLVAKSAGTAPATIISPLTAQVMGELNITIDADQNFPKPLDLMLKEPFDIVVNISGQRLPIVGATMIEWSVPDPIGQKEEIYRAVASQLEGLVMRLILQLRNGTL